RASLSIGLARTRCRVRLSRLTGEDHWGTVERTPKTAPKVAVFCQHSTGTETYSVYNLGGFDQSHSLFSTESIVARFAIWEVLTMSLFSTESIGESFG